MHVRVAPAHPDCPMVLVWVVEGNCGLVHRWTAIPTGTSQHLLLEKQGLPQTKSGSEHTLARGTEVSNTSQIPNHFTRRKANMLDTQPPMPCGQRSCQQSTIEGRNGLPVARLEMLHCRRYLAAQQNRHLSCCTASMSRQKDCLNCTDCTM